MDMKRLLGIRPKSETVEAIQASIADANAARDAALAEIAELEALRPSLLAYGTGAEIVAAESKLLATRTEAEQMGAMAFGLAPRLAAARHAEAVVALRHLAADAASTEARFVEWMGHEYRVHALAIGAGMMAETEALDLNNRLFAAMAAAPEAAAELGLTAPTSPAAKVYPGLAETGMTQVRYLVKLPAPAGPTGENGPHDWGWITARPGQH